MTDTLTNLLPPNRQRSLIHDYFVRVAVVIVLFISASFVIAAILLLPTYVYLTSELHTEKTRMANIETSALLSDDTDFSTRLSALANNLTELSSLAKLPSASVTVRSALDVSHTDITLKGFAYTPVTGVIPNMRPGTLSISGVAKTRDALRNYQQALLNAEFSTTADLPVSTYAKDSDISFTIVVTLAS